MLKTKLLFLTLCISSVLNLAYAANIPNSQTNADGSITITGSKNKQNTSGVVSQPAKTSEAVIVPQSKIPAPKPENFNATFGNTNNSGIPNSQFNGDGTITIKGGKNNAVPAAQSPQIVNQGKLGGTSASIGKATSGPSNSGVDLQALQKQVESGEVNLPSISYSGNKNDPSQQGKVLKFSGAEQGFQVSDSKEQPDRPDRSSAVAPGVDIARTVQSSPLPQFPVLASGMQKPTSAVVPLPPLPGMAPGSQLPPLPDMSGSIGIPNSTPMNPEQYKMTLNSNTTGQAIDYTGKSIELPDSNTNEDRLEEHWTDLMQTQANLLMDRGAPVKIAIVQTNNTLLRRFVIQGLLRSDDSRVSKMDTGLFPVMSQSYIDGKITPTCYILYDRKNLSVLNQQEFIPLSKATDEKTAAAFIVGHMAAHCMDQFERSKIIPLKQIWYPAELAKYGVQPSAFRRIFYMRLTPGQYFAKQTELFDDNAQRQYEERLADIFGILWVLSNNNTAPIAKAVLALRKNMSETSPHNTLPVLKYAFVDSLSQNNNSLSNLWQTARRNQFITGVSTSLGDAAPASVANADMGSELKGATHAKKDNSYVVGEDAKQIRKFGQSQPVPSFKSTPNFNDTNNPFTQ